MSRLSSRRGELDFHLIGSNRQPTGRPILSKPPSQPDSVEAVHLLIGSTDAVKIFHGFCWRECRWWTGVLQIHQVYQMSSWRGKTSPPVACSMQHAACSMLAHTARSCRASGYPKWRPSPHSRRLEGMEDPPLPDPGSGRSWQGVDEARRCAFTACSRILNSSRLTTCLVGALSQGRPVRRRPTQPRSVLGSPALIAASWSCTVQTAKSSCRFFSALLCYDYFPFAGSPGRRSCPLSRGVIITPCYSTRAVL